MLQIDMNIDAASTSALPLPKNMYENMIENLMANI
jgi:hypothetical protein